MDELDSLKQCGPHIIYENLTPADFAPFIPDGQQLTLLSEVFKVFGDPTRLRIISLLQRRELCVCDIAYILELGQSTVSHQLSTLRAAHVVKTRREGKSIFYALDDDHVSRILLLGLDHIKEEHHHDNDQD